MNEIQTAEVVAGEQVAFTDGKTIGRDANGNITISKGGRVVATVKKAKVRKVGYGQGLTNHFNQKNLQRIEAKKAKQAQ